MDEYTRAVAAVLKREQQKPGKPSYTEIAESTTLSRPTVERILNGRRDITTRYLRELCAVLGLEPSDVLDEAKASI